MSLVYNKKKVMKKRSTHHSLTRENCSQAERRFKDRNVEGSF